MRNSNIDRFIFVAAAVAVAAVAAPLFLAPDGSAAIAGKGFAFVTDRLGVAYVWAAVATLAFLIWLAVGRYGRIILGDAGEPPEHSNLAWAAMLFSAGIGTSVMHWGTVEWTYYYRSPPFGLEPGSAEAIEWAASYGLFHWGPLGWALYCLPAVALAHSFHVRKEPSLRLSSACRPVLGRRFDGFAGRAIDFVFVMGLLGSAATGLGFTTPLITRSFGAFTGVPESFSMTLAAMLLIVLIFAISVYAGLEKGIKRLSNINVALTGVLLAFILVTGPTLFILKMGTNSIGHVVQNFFRMATWTDPLTDSRFVEDWTVFYWAWWIAFGPFVGMFVARISRGRSVRQLIFGVLGFGSLGCTLCFVILGNYALALELDGTFPVVQTLADEDPATAIVAVMATLPLGNWILPLFFCLCVLFAATTYDSASYTLAAAATRNLTPDTEPHRWHRVFWALALGVLPAALLFRGELKTLKAASIVASLPVLAVNVILAVALMRALRRRTPDLEGDPK